MPKTNPNDYVDAFDTHDGNWPMSSGMTKREYFAIESLKGILSAGVDHDIPRGDTPEEWAVRHADALIQELNNTDFDA